MRLSARVGDTTMPHPAVGPVDVSGRRGRYRERATAGPRIPRKDLGGRVSW